MSKDKALGITDAVVNAVILAVQEHPRDHKKDKDGNRLEETHAGVFDYQVATLFYKTISKHKLHPLAEVKNDDCSWQNPCGKCRYDVLIAASEKAQALGKIVRIPPKTVEEDRTDGKGRTRKVKVVKGNARYYMAGQVPAGGHNYDELADKIASML